MTINGEYTLILDEICIIEDISKFEFNYIALDEKGAFICEVKAQVGLDNNICFLPILVTPDDLKDCNVSAFADFIVDTLTLDRLDADCRQYVALKTATAGTPLKAA